MGLRAKVTRISVVLAIMAMLVLSQAGCGKSPTTPDPPDPPPPTQYQHSLKVEAKTLHFGEAVTGTFTVKMLMNSKEFTANVGETVTLDTTTKQQEACDIIINCTACLPREFRNVNLTKNVLTTDVVKNSDVDWDWLHNEALTHKDNEGRTKNTSWYPRTMNASFNPDPLTGLRLDQPYIDVIKQTLQEFKDAGKRYAGTAAEEIYITMVTFSDLGNNVHSPTPPPTGEFQTFRESQFSGLTNITYPTTCVNVTSSREFVNQSSASPGGAYVEAFDALIGDGQEIGDLARHMTCVPMMMWRPRDTNSYWITATKESQEGIDTFSTLQILSMSPAEAQSLRTSPVSTILGSGATSAGRPMTSRGSPTSPAQTGPSRPTAKERIRN